MNVLKAHQAKQNSTKPASMTRQHASKPLHSLVSTLMARNFYRIFTENKPVMEDSKTFGIPEAKGLKTWSNSLWDTGHWTFLW